MKSAIFIFTAMYLLFRTVAADAFNCSITTTSLNFGIYDVFSQFPLDSTGALTVTCTNPEKKPLPITLTLTAGGSGNYAQRQLLSTTGGILNYNLYSDASRTIVFGDGSGGTSTFNNVISKTTPWSITYYGRIPARQNVVPGVYTDTLTATVLW